MRHHGRLTVAAADDCRTALLQMLPTQSLASLRVFALWKRWHFLFSNQSVADPVNPMLVEFTAQLLKSTPAHIRLLAVLLSRSFWYATTSRTAERSHRPRHFDILPGCLAQVELPLDNSETFAPLRHRYRDLAYLVVLWPEFLAERDGKPRNVLTRTIAAHNRDRCGEAHRCQDRFVGAQEFDRPTNDSHVPFHLEPLTLEAETPSATGRLLHELRDIELHDRPTCL